MVLQYEGTRYKGFQRQESTDNTIQGKLEELLFKMTGSKTEVNASGRTDAGVHAAAQVMSVCFTTGMSCYEILQYMNAYLPEDIAVLQVNEVTQRFHARLLAKGKKYCYRVHNSAIPNVFNRKYVYEFAEELDLSLMREAAGLLCGTHDFKAFTSAKKGKKSTVRTIDSIQIERLGDEVQFRFVGNGFLYHMVRILMGTLLQIGTKERRPEEITTVLESGLRENAGPLVPANGLILEEVYYS